MTGKQYDRLVERFRKKPELVPYIQRLNNMLTLTGFLVYPLILIHLIRKKDRRIIPFLLIPAAAFGLVSLFRRKADRSRPYENPDIHTLTRRDKKGQSFPSRHVFSYFLIGVLLFSLNPVPGILMLVTGIFLAWARVILGVHYPSDVLAGAILGTLAGVFTLKR